jgi:hypothetical protein
MTKEEFLQHRANLKKEKQDFAKQIDIRYNKILDEYVATNCPFKKNDVVLVGKGKRAKRMVIFAIDTQHYGDDDFVMINIYGWYLNAKNETDKWEGYGIAVTGISNPKPLVLDENQTYINTKAE